MDIRCLSDAVMITWLLFNMTGGKKKTNNIGMSFMQLCQKLNVTVSKTFPYWLVGGGTRQRQFRCMPSKVWVIWKGAYLSASHIWEQLHGWDGHGYYKHVKTWIFKLPNKEVSFSLLSGALDSWFSYGRDALPCHPHGIWPCWTPYLY